SPSSLGPALIALGATIIVTGPKGKTLKIAAGELFRSPKSETERETALKANEILTEIQVPIKGLKNATYEVRHRHGFDWPYVTASVAFAMKGGMISDAQVVLGQGAPVPWPSAGAGGALNNAHVNDTTAAKCGDAPAQGEQPRSGS